MKKLIEALHVIKDECNKHNSKENSCSNCPLWSDEAHVCAVCDLSPCNWKINNEAQKALL